MSGPRITIGNGLVQLGMSSKPLDDDNRRRHPGIRFTSIHIGEDAVAMVVSKDVWEAGIKSLGRVEAREIYEGRIRNWREVGGPDRRIAFFNKEPGRGTGEVFVHWLYGDAKKAPAVAFPEVGGNEETRQKVSTTRGALSQLSASWADGQTVFALGLKRDDSGTVTPTHENIATARYPMSRPLLLLSNGEPVGEAKVLVDFMLGPRGQSLVRKHGYLNLAQLSTNAPAHP